MVECWKPVHSYEDLYQVSDSGRVRRIVGGKGTYAGRIRQSRNNSRGYPCISLSRNGSQREQKVHSLVTEAFLGPCPAGLEVNHKNGIKEDNRIDNLEYVTRSENMKHSFRVLGQKPVCGETHGRVKLTDVLVKQIRCLYVKGGITQRELAERYGVSRTTIGQILRREHWAHVA